MNPERRLIVNSSSFETRAALLEDGVVAELFVERARSRGTAGNVYKAKVRKVLPGMQCAFLDLGHDRDAFLYVADIAEPPGEDDASLLAEDLADTAEVRSVRARGGGGHPPIESLLREGEERIVQVAKEPMASKGARVTCHLTLAGRYLVYMPTVRHAGVSRRIDDEGERARLRALVERLRERPDEGFIVRTAAEGHDEHALGEDARELRERWAGIVARAAASAAPALLHGEPPLVEKLLRDVAGPDLVEVVVDRAEDRERAREFLTRVEPKLVERLRLHPGPDPTFERWGIEPEIERALRSKVWLKSGGYIVVNQTEALVAIDVNTGRYVGKSTLEDTVLRINLEAVREIVRQIRLRDLGGIIVLDLIDMEQAANRSRVLEALEQELRRDRSKSKILQISDFGLVEMTRKRVKGSLERLLTSTCRACGGSGRVKSLETVCYAFHREVLRTRPPAGELVGLKVNPELLAALEGPERGVVEDLERTLGVRLALESDPALPLGRFEWQVP